MLATIAIVAAGLFVAAALYRLSAPAPTGVRALLFVLGLIAALCAIVAWKELADSRWLVGGVLLFVGGAASYARGGRGLMVSALVTGLLGAGLMVIATAMPRHAPPVPAITLPPVTAPSAG